MTIRDDCDVLACSHLPACPSVCKLLPPKRSCPLIVPGQEERRLAPLYRNWGPFPLPQVLQASRIKPSFPSLWPLYWLFSGKQLDSILVILDTVSQQMPWHSHIFRCQHFAWWSEGSGEFRVRVELEFKTPLWLMSQFCFLFCSGVWMDKNKFGKDHFCYSI